MKIAITLTKIEELDGAVHPNNIPVSHIVRGQLVNEPKVGERFYPNYWWSTSQVQEIIDVDTFKTYNSVYKISRKEVSDDFDFMRWIRFQDETEEI